MNLLPPMPAWDAFHVLVIHFPIALLMVAPIPIVLGLIVYKHRAGFFMSGLTLMLLGLASVYLAAETGEAAAGAVANPTPQISQAIAAHASMADRTEAIFTVLTLIYLALTAVPPLIKRTFGRKIETLLQAIFLIIYSAGLLVLVNTAHRGGVLVHGLGVHANLSAAALAAPQSGGNATSAPAPDRD